MGRLLTRLSRKKLRKHVPGAMRRARLGIFTAAKGNRSRLLVAAIIDRKALASEVRRLREVNERLRGELDWQGVDVSEDE